MKVVAFLIKKVIGGVSLDYQIKEDGTSLLAPMNFPDTESALAQIKFIRENAFPDNFSFIKDYYRLHRFELRIEPNFKYVCEGHKYDTFKEAELMCVAFYESLANAEVEVYV